MERRLFVFLSLLIINQISFAQRNYLKTDLLGYCNRLITPEDVRPIYGEKISLTFERILADPHFSFSINLNYGYTPHYLTVSKSPYSTSLDYYMFNGIYLFIDGRCYRPFKSEEFLTKFVEKAHNGFFLGPYAGLMHLEEKTYSKLGPNFTLFNTSPKWIIGIGGIAGYKLTFKQR